MLFYENLDEIVFNRHCVCESDEIVIISGYVGPSPVKRLETLPLKATVIYGMYGSEGIGNKLNQTLIKLNDSNEKLSIVYSTVPVHSKCYIWKKENKIKHVLIGSANFSDNGLCTPFREVLAETNVDTFLALEKYLNEILKNSIDCHKAVARTRGDNSTTQGQSEINPAVCTLLLYDPRTNEVPSGSGLNWGHGNAHTTISDAYVPIRAEYIRNYPKLFPQKQEFPIEDFGGRKQRNNDSIDIIWDDGTIMEGLLEGTIPIDGKPYPKQISSFPRKNILGLYFRKRLGLAPDAKITISDLKRYGRTTIDISMQGDGIYYFDFSV